MNGLAGFDALTDGGVMLAMMQLSDSALPVGRHAHAMGLERAVRDGRITNDNRLRQFVMSALIQNCARSDGAAAALAHDALRSGLESRLVEIDKRLDCLKLTKSSQAASRRCGRRLAVLAPRLCSDSRLGAYVADVLADRAPGHLAIVAAATAAACGVSRHAAVLMEVRGIATMILSAAVRLDILPAVASQAMLADLAPDVLRATNISLCTGLHELECSAAATIEIATMRHAFDHGRLFAT